MAPVAVMAAVVVGAPVISGSLDQVACPGAGPDHGAPSPAEQPASDESHGAADERAPSPAVVPSVVALMGAGAQAPECSEYEGHAKKRGRHASAPKNSGHINYPLDSRARSRARVL